MSDPNAEVRDLLNRIQELLGRCKYKEALPLARRAVALAPRSQDAWRELGSTCGYLGQVDEMEDAFDRALRLVMTPYEETLLWYERGHAENNAGTWMAALESFTRLTDLEPQWGIPWLMRGMVLCNMGDFLDHQYYEQALVALNRALEHLSLSPVDERVAYSLMGTALGGLGRKHEAEVVEQKVAEMLATERAARVKPRRREIH